MDPIIRKASVIMLGIGFAEGVPLALMFAYSRPGLLGRLATTPASVWPAWCAAFAVAAAYILYAIRGMPLIGQRFFEPHPLKLLAVVFALITGTMEEVWFRRQLMDWVQGLGAALALQVIVSALAFGLVHGVWGLFARNLRVAIGSVLATGALGAALAIVYLLADRHVAPCAWSHIAINLGIEPWLLVAAMSGGVQRRALASKPSVAWYR